MGPKCYKRETESLHCNLGGTELIRVSGSGYVKISRWRRIEESVGPSLTFRFGTKMDMRKWLRALEHITKHFEQASH